MQRGTWIILSGSGGELARTFVPEAGAPHGDLSKHFKAWIEDEGFTLCAGDTFRFEEGESEGPDSNA